jgi:hypothetical protein
LSRMEGWAFNETGLVETILPSSVDVLGQWCFAGCRSLSSVTFELGSKLRGVSEDSSNSAAKKCFLWWVNWQRLTFLCLGLRFQNTFGSLKRGDKMWKSSMHEMVSDI